MNCLPAVAATCLSLTGDDVDFLIPPYNWILMQLRVLPSVEELQVDPEKREAWINYSAFDAMSTHQLSEALRFKLQVAPSFLNPKLNSHTLSLTSAASPDASCTSVHRPVNGARLYWPT